MKKIRVGVLFGGKSAEHEISLLSAKNVIEALDREKYEVVLIGIDKTGEWHLRDAYQFLLNAHDPKQIQLSGAKESVALIPKKEEGQQLVSLSAQGVHPVDVVFPVLHGTYGEDGTVQGLLKLANVPFVGAGVLGSAIGMDKDVAKRLLRDASLAIPKFLSFSRGASIDSGAVVAALGLPLFVKPANAGSSVGITKVKSAEQLEEAVQLAFTYDRKILIEEAIVGRELECSVLGNAEPIASLPGEVISQHEFYSYEAKYIDEKGALFEIPAKLEPAKIAEVQKMAIAAYQALCCEGMARVDFFLKEDGTLLINEINTIPGFTSISMYPKMWQASGMSCAELIDRLIQLALERFALEQKIKVTV